MLRSESPIGLFSAFLPILLGMVSHAPGGDYFVAPNGSDQNSGARNSPFRTIQKAADAALPGDTCYIRAGIYREIVRPKRSGSGDARIRFKACPGEVVVLSGTRPLKTEWTLHKGRIYKARVRNEFDQLFVDGQMMTEARWPNMRFDQRFDKSAWATAGEGSECGIMVDPALAKTGIDFTGAVATLNVGSWQTYRRIVGNHKKGGDRFEYDRNMPGHVEAKRFWADFDHYYISGKIEVLDTPTEWHLDRDTGTLYIWTPEGDDPGNHLIEVKARDYAFEARELSHIEISGLHFFAATFKFEQCTDCVIENCHLLYPTWAKRLGPAAPTLIFGSRNTMRDSSVIFADGPGVTAKGDGNMLDNCLIHDVDFNALDRGHGVSFSGSASSTVRNCTVFNMGSSEGLTVAGHGPSIVEYNHIYNGGLLQSDGGLIQCHGINLDNTVIRFNWVHDHHAFNWGGIGIRGDDLTRNLLVHNNVVWNCAEKGIIVKGDSNRVYNNTCLSNARIDILASSRAEPFKPWATRQHAHLLDKQNANTHIANNVANVISGTFKWEKKQIPPLGRTEHNYRGNDFKLNNPASRDFRPASDSPLIDAGTEIGGITDKYRGKAPDIGAYEYGGRYWLPGCRNSLWVSAPRKRPNGEFSLQIALRMPPTEPCKIEINPDKPNIRPRALNFTLSDWMHPQTVTLSDVPDRLCMRFTSKRLGNAAVKDLRSIDRDMGRVIPFDRPMLSRSPEESDAVNACK